MALLDQLRHEPVKESQHQCINMGTVHVGIRHDNDLVITEFGNIEIIMDAGAEGSDHCFDLFIGVDPVFPGLFHIQDLSAQGQDGLGRSAACGFGTAARGISLYQENFTVLGILIGTVRQLAGKTHGIQDRFPSGHFPGLPGRFPGPLGHQGFINNGPGNGRILFQKIFQLFGNNTVRGAPGFHIAQLLLGLPFKLGILDLDADDCRDAFTDILTGQIGFIVL